MANRASRQNQPRHINDLEKNFQKNCESALQTDELGLSFLSRICNGFIIASIASSSTDTSPS